MQELILSLLSRERKGQYNRFMVGDVKQSIYRFRLADAAIFMDKYHRYADASEDEHMQRIDLSRISEAGKVFCQGLIIFPQDHEEKVLAGLIMTSMQHFIREWNILEAPGKILPALRKSFPDSRFGGSIRKRRWIQFLWKQSLLPPEFV